MATMFVMTGDKKYTLEEVDDSIKFSDFKERLNGGWPEIAYRCDPGDSDLMIPGCTTGSGIMVICDSDGHPKNLDLTWFRPTDNAPLVGKLYWISYDYIWDDEGCDYDLKPMDPETLVMVQGTFIQLGWEQE
jgi:hypothetical protein